LGALTHGDRRAGGISELSKYHLDNEYGEIAVNSLMEVLVGKRAARILEPYDGFFNEARTHFTHVGLLVFTDDEEIVLRNKTTKVLLFLNRILGLPVKLQLEVFSYVEDLMTAIMNMSKRKGLFDLGISGIRLK